MLCSFPTPLSSSSSLPMRHSMALFVLVVIVATLGFAVAGNLESGQKWLASVAAADPSIVTLPSGLMYKVIKEGHGAHPTTTSQVTVHYRGTLEDGTQFDSSYERGQPAVSINPASSLPRHLLSSQYSGDVIISSCSCWLLLTGSTLFVVIPVHPLTLLLSFLALFIPSASHPQSFGVTQVIRGWTEALQLMSEGAEWEVWIPSNLAYGSRGAGPLIKADSALKFTIELIAVQNNKRGGGQQQQEL